MGSKVKAAGDAANVVTEYVIRRGKNGVWSKECSEFEAKQHFGAMLSAALARGEDTAEYSLKGRSVAYDHTDNDGNPARPSGEESHGARGEVKEFAVALVLALAVGVLAYFFPVESGSAILAMAAAAAPYPGRGYIEVANILTGGALNLSGTTTFGKDFPLGEGWLQMKLRFNYVVVIGTGTGAATEGELLILKNILLKSDRGEIFVNLPARAIYKISIYQTGQVPRKDAVAASNGTYRVTLPIIFADMDMRRPNDTIIDTSRYTSVSLQVTMGSLSDFYSSVGTSTLVATVDIEVERTLGVLPPKGKPIQHINYDYRQPVDANSLTVIDLERSADMSLKRLYVHSSTSGIGGVPWSGTNADTIQNIVTVKDQNRFIQKERIHAMVQDGNKADAFLESVIAGVEVYDFVRDGSITSALATGNKSVLQYTWTNQGGVGANSIVTATTEQIRSLK